MVSAGISGELMMSGEPNESITLSGEVCRPWLAWFEGVRFDELGVRQGSALFSSTAADTAMLDHKSQASSRQTYASDAILEVLS